MLSSSSESTTELLLGDPGSSRGWGSLESSNELEPELLLLRGRRSFLLCREALEDLNKSKISLS